MAWPGNKGTEDGDTQGPASWGTALTLQGVAPSSQTLELLK